MATVSVYHLIEMYTRRVSCVLEARSEIGALITANTLDPDCRFLLLDVTNSSKVYSRYILRTCQPLIGA